MNTQLRVAHIAAGALLLLAAWLPDRAHASTAADVCATVGNTCAGTTARIDVPTTVTCPSTLDFAALGFPDVIVTAELKTTGAPLCVLTLDVGTLTVTATGKITHPHTLSNAPGQVTVRASALPPATAILIAGQISVGGGAGAGPCAAVTHLPAPVAGTGPCIELFADADIVVDGKLTASATTSGAHGGLIEIVSAQGKVAINTPAVLTATSTDPGGTHIQIEACAGLDIAGTLNASAKTTGAEIHLLSREYINIAGGKVIADLQIGGLGTRTHEVTIEARDTIALSVGALVSATAGGTNATGGTIHVLSTEGGVSCDAASLVRAYAVGAGGAGGSISLRAFDDVVYNCNGADAVSGKQGIVAIGNFVSGRGGTVQLQSFDADVKGTGTVRADGPAFAPGAIVLTGAAALTDGGTCSITTVPGACAAVATLHPNMPTTAPLSGVLFGPDGIAPCVLVPDVSVTKTTSTPTITAGATASYTVAVSVTGVTDATNVTLTDTLPAGLTWSVGGPNAAVCSIAAGVLTCPFGTLSPGSTRTITLSATTTAANCPAIVNSATVAADDDADAGNNASGPVQITVNCPDVRIAKSTSTPTVNAGSNAVYSVVVTANGPGTSSNVTLTDSLPAGLDWTVGGPDAAACAPASPVPGGSTLTCTFGTMAPGSTRTISLTAATSSANCPSLSNTATVSAAIDTVSSNNSSGPSVITVSCPDVSVQKTATADTVPAGATAGYSIVVSANGPGTSSNVTLTDVVPAGLTWTVAGADAAACSPASPVPGGTTLTCLFATMPAGSTKTISLSAPTSPANCPSIANTASVTAPGDVNAANNSSGPIPIAVTCLPDLTVSKTTSTPLVTVGQNASYGITVTAGGSASSTNVTLVDVLPGPPDMLWAVSGGGAGACTPNPVAGGATLTCAFGTMAIGSTQSIALTAAATAAACGALNNSATVGATLDSNPGNNSAGPVLVTVQCPDVSIAKVATTPTIPFGGVAGYSITVTANGPGNSQNVTLTDPLPVGVIWTVGGPHAAACTPASPVAGGTTLTCQFGQLAPGDTRTITLTGTTTVTWNFAGTNTVTGTAAGASFTTGGRTVHLDAFVASTATTNGTPAFVYGKDEGAGEQGVGVCASASGAPLVCQDPNTAHEIDADQDGFPGNNLGMIRIDLGADFASLGHLTISMGSVQPGESFRIFAGDSSSIASATLIYLGSSADDGQIVPLSGVRRFLFFKAGDAGDVLVQALAATTCGPIVNTATVSATVDGNTQNNSSGPVTIAVTNCPTVVPTFKDVGTHHPYFAFVEALAASGITGGCSTTPPLYCPEQDVTRAQMAVFLLRGIHGAGFVPPPATGTTFADVPVTHPFAAWIEQLSDEGITGGCATNPLRYCPDAGVRRDQVAVFLLRAKHGAGFQPPAATGTLFLDVPLSHPLAAWIEQLAADGITAGCGANLYCPDETVTRGEIAVFLVRTFNLPL